MLKGFSVLLILITQCLSELIPPDQSAQFQDCFGKSLKVTALDLSTPQCPVNTVPCKMQISGVAYEIFDAKYAEIDVQKQGVSFFKQTVTFTTSCAHTGSCILSHYVSMPVVVPSGTYTAKTVLKNEFNSNLACFTHDVTL